MIAYVDGKLTFREPTSVIIEVNGIGYELKVSLNTSQKLKQNERCKLLTHLHIREDAQILYGFLELAEKKMFLDLISISGIGPNTAIAILSSMSPEELQACIGAENVKAIQNVKGIGAKTAQRLILELKDRVKKDLLLTSASHHLTKSSHNTLKNEALSALVTLGIQKSTAEKTIEGILEKEGDTITLERLIKLALKNG